ncbi:MAG: helix-turn-helix domain-containing protein [Bacteroidales bacterium]|nr:helix-turn-helix domain-containing protein [Bacteroidales bacterium]MCM1148196.1 helix-turn-helix domain-containing protein [Bacteroidales bacterium]MCM1207077.1 helix-turn-helix domain-containing protein [Bacillota bacterium]MCM1510821.1 helix-turn-helix domain-containing protein [Clostridium sp.]
MKDRIRQLMESQHMNQQSFSNFIGVSPASLSSILQERTRPTLNIVEAIRSKMPTLNTDWLMWGEGEMFQPGSVTTPAATEDLFSGDTVRVPEPGTLDFGDSTPSGRPVPSGNASPSTSRQQRQGSPSLVLDTKNIDKAPRRITEIRVFYDDQTWESFVPKK